MTGYAIYPKGEGSAFLKPRTSTGEAGTAFIYGTTLEELTQFIAPWPWLYVYPLHALGMQRYDAADDYLLPGGWFRLYLDLCATYGDPP
jgi:hypothetical protein